MLFPIIEVMDKGNNGQRHIVGTSPHDCLTIEPNGLIGYYNLQNGEGTAGDYEFVGCETGWGIIVVRLVCYDELIKLYKEQCELEERLRDELGKVCEKFLNEEGHHAGD